MRNLVVHSLLAMPIRALLPATCMLCGESGQRLLPDLLDICAGCDADLPRIGIACGRCAEPLTSSAQSHLTCGRCLRKPLRFDRAFCPYRFQYPIDHLLRAFKFHGRVAYGRALGELFARELRESRLEPWPELIVPVPLATARFRERGFNQAIELGNVIEQRLGIPLRADLLTRTRNTQEQTGLDRASRRKNLRKAFSVVKPIGAKHVAILDDVFTTGSTLDELARTMKRAGVERIEAWAVARTPKL